MRLFGKSSFDEGSVSMLTVSAAFARQRFMCSPAYINNVCRGGCCVRDYILLSDMDVDFVNKYGDTIEDNVFKLYGEKCPFLGIDGVCQHSGTSLMPFLCRVFPFVLSKRGKLVVSNSSMLRKCRIRKSVRGGNYAYRVFSGALRAIFGDAGYAFLYSHLESGGGDLTLPVDREVLKVLYMYREVLNAV